MDVKVGKNDPCPCGSGKKYKKCCFIRSFNPQKNERKAEYGLLKTYFRSFREKDLFSTIGALQLIPENDFHAVRLEVAAQIACSIQMFGDKDIDIDDFITHLNKFLPTNSDIGFNEDPPEHLYTENISFVNGNNIVYPSIYHEENSILENFFLVLNSHHEKFPEKFVNEVMLRIGAILTISNKIAFKLDHVRYMDCVHDWHSKREDIQVPDKVLFFRYKNAVTFQKKDIEENISPIDDVLAPFCLKKTEYKFRKDEIDSHELVSTPLANFKDELVVLNPISLLCALRHYVIKSAKKFRIEKEFTFYYREILWAKSFRNLFLMGYDPLEFSFPLLDKKLPIVERLFRIDTNKIAFVQLISDTAENYNTKKPKGLWDTRLLIDQIHERDIEIVKKIKTDFQSHEILILKIFSSIGRQSGFIYQNLKDVRTLLISEENLKIASLSGKCDQLTFWKYFKANADAFEYYHYLSHSFLDKFAFYEEYNTLILGPRIFPNIIPIPPGYGKKLRVETTRIIDDHLAEVGEPDSIGLVAVQNAYRDPNIPIYQPKEPVCNYSGYEIEGYFQPIWVFYDKKINEMELETFHLANDFTKTIAYWFSQVTPSLRDHLKPLGMNPIHIFIRCDNIAYWENILPDDFDNIKENGAFAIGFQGRAVFFEIPNDFVKQLKGANNEGERVLLRGLLNALAKFVTNKLKNCNLNDKEIELIINDYAPLGIKKQFFLFMSGAEGLLLNKNLPGLRLIQYHDIQEQSLGITAQLNRWNFFNPLSQSEKADVCKAIVDIYVKRIKASIKDYRWDDLLKSLIGSYDSVLHNGKKMHILAPYHEACYPDDSEFIQRMMQDLSKIDQTLLYTRTLIEIIIAEPPFGKKISNTDDTDKMLALVNNMMDWATAADFYYHNLLQSNFEFGVGERIFVPMRELEDKYVAFLKEKTQESVEGSYEHYKKEFDYRKKRDRNDISNQLLEMDSAFLAEFGFNTNQIGRFFCCLIHSTEIFICPEQDGPVYSLDKNEFKKRIMKTLQWTESDVNKALKEFSLTDRGLWENAPKGYKFESDIAPWKFRRRCSHARRPLLIGPEPKDNPIILWGSLNSERALTYIGELVADGRYDTTHSTSEMKSYIAKILREKGEDFTNYVEGWFKKNSEWVIKKSVQLPEKLGDIDVLAIDEKRGIMYSIECKNLNFGRNAKEMANEIIRLYHGDDGEDPWILKHKNRDKWLKENFEVIIKKYSLPSKQYEVSSLVLTSEAIPASFLHEFDPDIPIFSFNQLERDGINKIERPT